MCTKGLKGFRDTRLLVFLRVSWVIEGFDSYYGSAGSDSLFEFSTLLLLRVSTVSIISSVSRVLNVSEIHYCTGIRDI